MKGLLAGIFSSVAGLVGVVVLIVAFSFGGLYWYRLMAPKWENARREVFEETRSYNQGKIQQLAKYRHEYMAGDAAVKTVIASTIRHQFADYNVENLPPELQSFLRTVRGY